MHVTCEPARGHPDTLRAPPRVIVSRLDDAPRPLRGRSHRPTLRTIEPFALAALLISTLGPMAHAALPSSGTGCALPPSIRHYELAQVEIAHHLYPAAEKELRAALALKPDYTLARFSLGALLLRAGNRDGARNAFILVARVSQNIALRVLADSLRDSIQYRWSDGETDAEGRRGTAKSSETIASELSYPR